MGKPAKQISISAQTYPTLYGLVVTNYVTNSITENTYYATNFTIPNGEQWSLCLPDKSSTTVYAPDYLTTGDKQKTTTEVLYYGIDYGSGVLTDPGSSADQFFLPAQKNTLRNDLSTGTAPPVLDADDVIENYTYVDVVNPNGAFTPRPKMKTSFLYGNNFDGERLSREVGEYDTEGREIRKAVWNGYKTPNLPGSGDKELTNSFVYDTASSLLLAETNAKGIVSKYSYEVTGRFLTISTNALGDYAVRNVEPVWGIVTNEMNANAQTNWYRYDQLNRLRTVYGTKDQPDFNIPFLELPLEDFGYPADKPTLSYSFGADSGANSATTRRKKFFDDSHLLPGETPYIEATAFSDGLGRTIQTKIRKSATTDVISGRTDYDALGRVVRRYDPSEAQIVPGYINYGANEGRTAFFQSTTYDEFGRPVTQGRGGVFTTSRYLGLYVNEVVDPRNNVKRSVKDIYGQVVRVEDYLGPVAAPAAFYAKVDYQYDLRGNLLKTIDAKGNQIAMGYDELGRKVSMNDPDMGGWQYRYDDYGQLTNQVDAKNQKTFFDYDIRGQLTNKSYENTAGLETEVSYFYATDLRKASFAKLTNVADGSGIESYAYDETGSVTNIRKQVAGGGTFDTTYDYDALGRVRQIAYPHAPGVTGLMVRYEYRADNGLLNRIGKIANWNDPTGAFTEMYMAGLNYDQKGRRTDMTYGNNTKTSYLYNEEIGRLNENKVEKTSTGFALQDTFYAFDNNGNVLAKTETVEQMVHEYNYDELNRLVTARLVQTNAEIYSHKYSYDEVGNILVKDVDSLSSPTLGNRGYQYVKPHAVAHFIGEFKTDLSSSYDYTYDGNGNMTSETISYMSGGTPLNRSKTMTWDADNLMRSLTADGTTTTMIYDHTGERTRKAVSTGKVTDYVAGLSQIDSSGEVLSFVFDGINRIASVKKVGAVAQTFFMHTDQLGSTTLVTSGD
ncbi:MAG: RHS repeat protein, partial [Spirochaetia bacterium]|nr:RHS repeat protein [Spirochaetia bacterium]